MENMSIKKGLLTMHNGRRMTGASLRPVKKAHTESMTRQDCFLQKKKESNMWGAMF